MRKFYLLFLFFLSFLGLKAQYCTPTGGSSSTTYYLKTISLSDQNSINYTATAYQAYVNNSAQTVNSSPGGTIQLNLATSSSTAKYYVYIDWNNDFDFNDAGENPIATTSYAATYTGNITVPAAQAYGSYRIRIENGFITPASPITACGPSAYGNFVDFTIQVGAPPTCIVPTALTSSNILANSATLSWTASVTTPANGYEYYMNTTGVPPTGATAGTAVPTGTSVTVGSLAANTTYYWWVRAICSSTDKSFWAAGSPFKTLCTAITTLPWTENFDSLTPIGSGIVPSCWKQVTGTYAWTSANAASTTFNAPKSTPNYMRIQYGNTTASQLWTPGFALTAGTTYEYSFYYNTGGTTSSYIGFTGNALVNTSQSATGATTLGAFITATQGTNGYVLYKVYYTPTVSGTYNFGVSVSATSAPWYLGVDDFKVRVAPTCTDPQGLTVLNTTTSSTTIQWTVPAPAPAGGYDVYYTTSPAIPAPTVTPQYTGVTGPTQLITGLAASTTYYIWVRARCSSTDIGDWTGPLSVYTNYCVPTGGSSSTTYYLKNITTTGGFTNLAYTASTYSAYVNNSATSFSALPGTTVNVSMNSGTSSYYYYLWIDWNNDMVFDPLTEAVYATTAYTTTGTTTINTAGHPAGSYRARFATSFSGAITPCGSAPYGNYVDYTFIIKPCSTTAPTNVYVDAISHISATVHWTQSTNNLNYKVYWREVGTTGWPNSSALLAPPTNSFVIPTGLQPAKNYEVMVVAVCNTTEGTATPVQFATKCDPTPPNVTVSNITTTSALITWAPLAASSTYVLRYRIVGSGATGWSANIPLPAAPANTYTLGNLNVYTSYEVQIANICNGTTVVNPWSNPKVFTTERTCVLPPPGLTITNLTPTSAVVVWDPFPGATYILRYRKVGIPSWTNVPVSINTLTLTGLLELTKYEMQVVNVCSGTPGTYTQPYFFTTPTVTYCPMSSTSAANEFISKVTVKPNGKPIMENTSVGSTYTDYTGVPAKFIELIQGSTGNQITIEKSWLGTNNNEGVAVWIDFDRNGYFDINERILASPPSTTTPVTGTFNVPADAFISLTDYKYVVMRVALQRDGIPVNCTSFANGEVEDYTVRISKTPVPNATNQTDIMIYPNPVKTTLNVKNTSPRSNYKIYNAAGQIVSAGIILNNKINVSNLINGVYVIDIDDVKGTAQKKFIKE